MTDVSQSTKKLRAKPRRSFEFVLYFTVIFFLAIPFSTVIWIAEVFRKKSIFVDGPIARSRAEADRITPVIFSA
tara:strand:- start:217 stop:438 length:222 start_codon:yes stop_codon:yes gene_type:complete